ncbi:hypothetical protein [Streptomyces sp. WZ-12]|uniref:hypothetical protein n=1 Tax=Streptomyces sp. WZ-12 TaxID=3030210 RepID=UPI00238106A9|nr:hypothetical protein [Streptomyces sp. WZ-12]
MKSLKSKWAVAASGVMAVAAFIGSTPAASAAEKPTKVHFSIDGVNIRAKPDVHATVVGIGYKSHSVTGYCMDAIGDATFMKIKDHTTGVSGWSYIQYVGPLSGIPYCRL